MAKGLSVKAEKNQKDFSALPSILPTLKQLLTRIEVYSTYTAKKLLSQGNRSG